LIVSLSIALPILSAIEGARHPTIRAFVALAAIILLLLDTGWLEKIQKERTKLGAKLQEQFDTEVYGLSWNRFVAGKPVEPEDLQWLSATPLGPKRESEFLSWYEHCVGQLPIHLGRMVCQRTNIRYDSRIRRRYGGWVLGLVVAFAIVLLLIGLLAGLGLRDLILSFAVPFLPLMTWALKEHRQQTNSAIAIENLMLEWEKLWTKALEGAPVDEVEPGTRNLQDAIYQYRERNPLVFDWVYRAMRRKNEEEAKFAAEDLVAKAKKALQEREQQ